MRQLFFAVACVLLTSCEDILPVENVDLCEGDQPASADCAQCKERPIPAGCPQCSGESRDDQCVNASTAGGNSGSSGDGASGDGGGSGNASTGGSSGSGSSGSGDSGTGSAGSSGTGVGGSSGSTDSGTGGSDAGTGGSAGSAGSGDPQCMNNGDCNNPTPQCSAQKQCVACTKSSACTGRAIGELCDTRASSANKGLCVACVAHSDCTDPLKPQCSAEGQCVGCTTDDACTGRSGTPRCDNTGAATGGQCVQCMMHTDCTSTSAPECKADRTCQACSGNGACTGRNGAKVCDLSGDTLYSGTCVECTTGDETACGDDVCTPSTRACAIGHTKLSRDTCQTCIADSECVADHRCIPMKYDGADRPNAYCLRQFSSTCINPYASSPINRASVSGAASEDYCGINEATVSCEAVAALIANVGCTSGDDTECGADGSICRTVNGALNRCTYECSISLACPNDADCSSAYCGGP